MEKSDKQIAEVPRGRWRHYYIIATPQKIISIVLGAGQLQLLISAGFHSISYNKKLQTQLFHTQHQPT